MVRDPDADLAVRCRRGGGAGSYATARVGMGHLDAASFDAVGRGFTASSIRLRLSPTSAALLAQTERGACID